MVTNTSNSRPVLAQTAKPAQTAVQQALPANGQAEPDAAQMRQMIAALMAENSALKTGKTTSLGIKVSEKGAVSVYGIGRFPVTLYQEQWSKLLAKADEVKAFIEANKAVLKVKEAAAK